VKLPEPPDAGKFELVGDSKILHEAAWLIINRTGLLPPVTMMEPLRGDPVGFSETEKLRFAGNVPFAVPDGVKIFIQESDVDAVQFIWQPSSVPENTKLLLFAEDEKLTTVV